jgi:hypothetical protein
MIIQFIHYQYSGGDHANGELKEIGIQTEDERKDPHVMAIAEHLISHSLLFQSFPSHHE